MRRTHIVECDPPIENSGVHGISQALSQPQIHMLKRRGESIESCGTGHVRVLGAEEQPVIMCFWDLTEMNEWVQRSATPLTPLRSCLHVSGAASGYSRFEFGPSCTLSLPCAHR